MYALRQWAIRHSGPLELAYAVLEKTLHRLHPLFQRIGYRRVEAPVALVERGIKGLVFDSKMCGDCVLGSTGMSCPTNCPKSLRNGPCGGVRPDGGCEVKPEMRCVWVDAWDGSQGMAEGAKILDIQPPLDHRLAGLSSWLRVARGEHPGSAGRDGAGQ